MSVEKLKRVCWRLREVKVANLTYTHAQIRKAIMEEIGTDDRTVNRNIQRMLEFKMLEKADLGKMKLIADEEINVY